MMNLEVLMSQSRKKFDNTRVDWDSAEHTGSSMLKFGVYPEGMTKEQVEKEVEGSWGGRFERFGQGKFLYVAYTD